MYEEFQQDSPMFRSSMSQTEEALQQINTIFNDWISLSMIAHNRGQSYIDSMTDLLKSLCEHPSINALGSYKTSFSEIKEMLSTLLACHEGFIFSLQSVFASSLQNFIDTKIQPLSQLKKNYEKILKEIELIKSQTVALKKSYTQKNPSQTESHFIKLHLCEKSWEIMRYDYSYLLSSTNSAAQTLALDQFLSLVFTQWSFTNTAIENLKSKENVISKLSDTIQKAKQALVTREEWMKKEKEGIEMHLNLYKKLPQFKENKEGYLWKQADFFKDWKRRYFKINESELVYYRGQQEILYTTLVLSKITELIDYEHLFAFEIYSATTQKSFILLAESDAEVKEWVYALKLASEQGLLGYEPTANIFCADCLAKAGEWYSLNLGVHLCTTCSGIHRSLGCHISKVKSLHLDNINPITNELISELHNHHDEIWGQGFRPPQFSNIEDRDAYIRSKYQLKSYMIKCKNPNEVLSQAIEAKNVVTAFKAILSGAELTSSRRSENNADIKISENSFNFLHQAARVGDLKMIELLILNGCDPEGRNIEGFTPLEVALISQQNDAVNYILKALEITPA
ncbi:unnamed protein product [Blepharisma stoltei]|uniref:Uncharacterized protein n=1 Tax=Blepharisma stoltei TaxID=1481888 RepID=A0AAU9JA42_9CILI|nr:unnamed protein product [Blepharisma stoltei]